MRRDDVTSDGGVIALVRETANGLGELAELHLKMARRELASELAALGSQAAWLGGFAALLLVGYALAMAGVAILLGGHASVGWPFVIVGGGHVVLATTGLVWVRRRKTKPPLLEATVDQAKTSVAGLVHAHP